MSRASALAVGATVVSHSLFLLALGAVGLLVGGLLALARVNNLPQREPWEPLGSPPKPVTELIRIDWEDVYVAATDGEVYRCCWERTELPEFPTHPPSHFPCDVSIEKSTPPGQVVDRLDVTYCGPDYGISYGLALLEDGTVWKWSYDSSPLGAFGAVVMYSLCGAGAGLLIGGSIAVRSWRRRMRKWRQPEEMKSP